MSMWEWRICAAFRLLTNLEKEARSYYYSFSAILWINGETDSKPWFTDYYRPSIEGIMLATSSCVFVVMTTTLILSILTNQDTMTSATSLQSLVNAVDSKPTSSKSGGKQTRYATLLDTIQHYTQRLSGWKSRGGGSAIGWQTGGRAC